LILQFPIPGVVRNCLRDRRFDIDPRIWIGSIGMTLARAGCAKTVGTQSRYHHSNVLINRSAEAICKMLYFRLNFLPAMLSSCLFFAYFVVIRGDVFHREVAYPP